MIREIRKNEVEKIVHFLSKDNVINYFLRLGLLRPEETYEHFYGDEDERGNLRAVLMKRKSGNYQFYADGAYDAEGIASLLKGSDYRKLMAVESILGNLVELADFSRIEKLAYIAELKPENFVLSDAPGGDVLPADDLVANNQGSDADGEGSPVKVFDLSDVKELSAENIGDVVALYTKVFNGFTPKDVMIEKLKSRRGRGVYIANREGRMISVAQSEFEDEKSAVIVGVATDPDYRNRGLANRCLSVLCRQLLEEGKNLYLQYDNMEAGRIYEKMGFKFYDRVVHCYR